jgi:long-chain acyl-CoA synthetase
MPTPLRLKRSSTSVQNSGSLPLGVPDPYRGETVKAFVVLKEKQQAIAEEIIEYCQKNMAKYKVPTSVEFRQELPKSNVGKVLRKMLREEETKKSSDHLC